MRKKIKRKIFALSDIHGHITEVRAALEEAGFDSENKEHLLLVLGDLFDRGHENKLTDSFLRDIKNKVLIRGNHEDILMETLATGRVGSLQYDNGTLSTLFEFFPTYDGSELFFSHRRADIITTDRLIRLIESMQDYFETDNYIFTHGWLPTVGMTASADYEHESFAAWHRARWQRWPSLYGESEIPKGKTLVVGHTSARYGGGFDHSRRMGDTSIFRGDGMIAIDGSTDSTGLVNVLVAEDTMDAPESHTLVVDKDTLDAFAKDKRSALTRLYDEKHSDIRPGDTVLLTADDGRDTLSFKVVSCRLYHNLSDFEEDVLPEMLGLYNGSAEGYLAKKLRSMYSFEDIADYGILVLSLA